MEDIMELLMLYANASEEVKSQIALILAEDESQSERQDLPS